MSAFVFAALNVTQELFIFYRPSWSRKGSALVLFFKKEELGLRAL